MDQGGYFPADQRGATITRDGGQDESARTGWGRRTPRAPSTELEVTVAFAVSFIVALRLRLPHEIPVGYVVAALLLPVSVTTLWRYRGILPIAVLSVAAAITGLALTAGASGVDLTDKPLAVIHTGEVLAIPVVTMALLWARSTIGTRNTVLMYGLGMLASVAIEGVNYQNAWKYSFSVPVLLLVMSLPRVYRERGTEVVLLVGLAGFSALNDSRSAAAQMLIAALLVLLQGARRRRDRPGKTSTSASSRILVRIGVLVLASFYLLQEAIVEGTIGSEVQERTIQQIDNSGSLLLGGRPEVGATAKLLKDQPWGYGSGTLASQHNLQEALDGMSKLGYDPDSRYIQKYMLFRGFEVHSFAGDLWILFGFAGLALAIALGLYLVYGIARNVGDRMATGVVLYLALRSVWDLAFSPVLSTLDTLPLTLAVILALAPDRGSSGIRRIRTRF